VSCRTAEKRFRRLLKKADRLLAPDSRKVFEKLVEGIPASSESSSARTGTRVPTKTGVPERISGWL